MLKSIFKTLIVAALAIGFGSAPAMAQATRTWVSGVGDDVNPCSRTAPCKTFAGAISKTAANGEINCLDPAGFGSVTIVKPITIRCDGVIGGVLAAGTYGILVNITDTVTYPNARVVIDGLDIDGVGNSASTYGIRILAARDVLVRNTIIRGFAAAASGDGIMVDGTAQIALTVENTTIFNNNIGIRVQSSSGNGTARVYDSLIAVGTSGISVTGAGNKAEISGNQIIRATKSLEILSGGVVNSYGDNVLSTGDAPTIVPKG